MSTLLRAIGEAPGDPVDALSASALDLGGGDIRDQRELDGTQQEHQLAGSGR